MRVTKETLKDIPYIYGYRLTDGQTLLENLLDDIAELNKLLADKCESYRQVYIDYIDEHNEYSAERTDPCPDYFGMFKLRFEKNPYETAGTEMTLDELDMSICVLINFTEFKLG